eukprot:jgi/Tetstr1/436405/TSEL_025236.t1
MARRSGGVRDRRAGLSSVASAIHAAWKLSGPPVQLRENLPIALPGGRLSMCFVEKCGSSRLKLLFLRGMGYTPAELLGRDRLKVHRAELRGAPATLGAYEAALEGSPRVIVVRSPYSRLLSAFLNKLRCTACATPGTNAAANADAMAARLHASARVPLWVRDANVTARDGFAALVHALDAAAAAAVAAGRRLAMDPHFAPISGLCLLPRGFHYDYILPLEAMDAWYADFLALAGLRAEAAGGWHINSHLNLAEPGQPCFYRPAGAVCADVPALEGSCAARPRPGAAQPRPPLQRSASNADELVTRFYTPELAAAVTRVYAEDLEAFGYAAWDGASPYDALAGR